MSNHATPCPFCNSTSCYHCHECGWLSWDGHADRCSHFGHDLPRTPDGDINNCALRCTGSEANCQMCGGPPCPDRERLGYKPPIPVPAIQTPRSPPPYTILIDTREGAPLAFGSTAVSRATLAAGDYSLRLADGTTIPAAVERKSKADLFHCVGRDRRRFADQYAKLALLERAYVLIECPFDLLLEPLPNSRVSPAAAVGTLTKWAAAYGVPWIAVPDRDHAARFVRAWLTAAAVVVSDANGKQTSQSTALRA